MRLIKISLIVMAILIVLGFSFVGYVSYQRMTGSGYFAKGHAAPDPALVENLVLGGQTVVAALGLPATARIESIHDQGNRVLLLIRDASLGDQLYLIEPRTGAVISAIAVGAKLPTLPPSPPTFAPTPSAVPPVPGPNP